MFSVRQPIPNLISAKRKLSDSDFGALLRAIVIIAFRYNIIGEQRTGEQEQVYHVATMQLHKGDATNLVQVLTTLRHVYPNDDAFKADFSEKMIKTTQSRNAKIVRYILCKLEKQIGGVDFDADSPSYTLEHVLIGCPNVWLLGNNNWLVLQPPCGASLSFQENK